MSSYDDRPDDNVEELLSKALTQEADLVEVSPGALQTIQARTAAAGSATRSRRVVGSLGAGLAAAAVVTAIIVVGGNGTDDTVAPATQPDRSSVTQGTYDPSPSPHDGVYDPSAPAKDQVQVYYVGGTFVSPDKPPRLYEETHTVPGADPDYEPLVALNEVLTATPIDPDYAPSSASGVWAWRIYTNAGVTTVDLKGPSDPAHLAGLGIVDHSYPAGYQQTESMQLQAILRTIDAQRPVTFTYNGKAIDQFLLQPLPVSPASDNDVRAWISIDNIVDGQIMTSPVTVKVSGNVFEGNVNWTLFEGPGLVSTSCIPRCGQIDSGYVTTSMGTWTQADVDLGHLDAGMYTFVAYEVSAKDGSIINADSKTFHIAN